MRHRFLLDENIIYHAFRGVDRNDVPDDTAVRLIETISKVCHSVLIPNVLMAKYSTILDKLKLERSRFAELFSHLAQMLKKIEKRTFEYDALPSLPLGCNDIPPEDRYLVQAAMISHPLLVTADEALYTALKNHPELEIDVLWPHEALERAKESPTD